MKFGFAILLFAAVSLRSAEINVGVFVLESMRGPAVPPALRIIRTLENLPGIKAEVFHSLTLPRMDRYDVVLAACVHSVGRQEDNWRDTVRTWVESGGSLVLFHDSCGFAHAFSPSLFPEIMTPLRRDRDPVLKLNPAGRKQFGMEEVRIGYPEFVYLVPGRDAEAWADALVIGKFGAGKVLACGYLPGYDHNPEQPEKDFLARLLQTAGQTDGAPPEIRALRKQLVYLKAELDALKTRQEREIIDLYNEMQIKQFIGK